MLVPILALAVMQQPSSLADNARGSRLYQACTGTVRLLDNSHEADALTDAQNASFCIGYIGGFLDAFTFSRPPHTICARGAVMSTVARVYVAYMQKHPKELDDEMSIGLHNAVLESYPCPSK